MRFQSVILFVFLISCGAVFSKEIQFEKKYRFDSKNIDKINIEGIYCDVYGFSENGPEITVIVEQEELNKDDENELLVNQNSLDIKLTKNCKKKVIKIYGPNHVEFETKIKKGDLSFIGSFERLNANIVLGGNVFIERFSKEVIINNKAGDIVFDKIGSNSRIYTGGGNIIGKEIGANCEIRAEVGNISIDNAQTIKAYTQAGNIKIISANGAIELFSLAGNIEAKELKGTITIESKNGDIKIERISGNFKLNSSDCDIKLNAVQGNFSIRNKNGAINLTLLSIENGHLEVENSKVDLIVPQNLKANLNVFSINSKFDSEIKLSKTAAPTLFLLNNGSKDINLDINLKNSKFLISKK